MNEIGGTTYTGDLTIQNRLIQKGVGEEHLTEEALKNLTKGIEFTTEHDLKRPNWNLTDKIKEKGGYLRVINNGLNFWGEAPEEALMHSFLWLMEKHFEDDKPWTAEMIVRFIQGEEEIEIIGKV